MNYKTIYAKLYLGLHLFLRLLKRMVFLKSRGLKAFLDDYRPDHIVPLTLEEKDLLNQAGRCLHCGLCDFGSASAGCLPSLIPSWARSIPDFGNVWIQLRDSDSYRDGEALCPVGIPIRRIIGFLQKHKS